MFTDNIMAQLLREHKINVKYKFLVENFEQFMKYKNSNFIDRK